MAKSARKQALSTIVNRIVPRRAPNTELRPREYLTEREIERLQDTARKRSRYAWILEPSATELYVNRICTSLPSSLRIA
jgi:hypothetical protein